MPQIFVIAHNSSSIIKTVTFLRIKKIDKLTNIQPTYFHFPNSSKINKPIFTKMLKLRTFVNLIAGGEIGVARTRIQVSIRARRDTLAHGTATYTSPLAQMWP